VSISPRFIDAEEASSAELACTAQGVPTPTIRWLPRTVSAGAEPAATHHLVTEAEDGRLVFLRLSAADEGEYVCEASNAAGTATERAVVYVRRRGV
jgi:hypothetical protein